MKLRSTVIRTIFAWVPILPLPKLIAQPVKGGVKVDHWGGGKLGQRRGWEIGDYRGVWRLERRPAVRLCGPRLGRSGRRHTPRGVLQRGSWRGFSGQSANCVCACSA
jgi:hypothetical protein